MFSYTYSLRWWAACWSLYLQVLSRGHGDASTDGGDLAVDAAADTVSAGDSTGHAPAIMGT